MTAIAIEPKLEAKSVNNELTKTTVFLQISFSCLGVERTSSGTEQDIKTEADKTLLRVKKQLFVSPEFKAIRREDAKLKRKVDKLCVQGALLNVRTVPNRNVGKVFALCTQHEVLRAGLVDKFVLVYPALYEQAKTQLGPLHKSSDYPDPKNVKDYFDFTYSYTTFDVPGQLKEIDSVIYQKQIGQRDAIMKTAAEEINKVRRATFSALLDKLKEELAPGQEGVVKKFHKSAVTKLQKFVDDYDIMDVTSDDELKALKSQCQKLIGGITVDNIKSSEEFKTGLLKEVSSLGELLKPLIEETGRALKIVR